MSGQLIGGAAGALVGSFAGPGGSKVGWLVGSMVGGSYDQKRVGPTTRDLTPQTSEYGKPIPIVWGSTAVGGNVIWAPPFIQHEGSAGGKGGGGGQTTYSYTANFAVLVCKGVADVQRIWAGAEKRLIYDGVNPPQLFTLRLYRGTEDQLPDPLIEQYKGAGRVPAYRGYTYVVFENYPLREDGNALPFLTIEVGPKKMMLHEYVYPVTQTTRYGSDFWVLGSAMVYDPGRNEWWALTRWRYGDTVFPTDNVMMIIDGTTQMVKQYIARTNEPSDVTTENTYTYDLFYDPIEDAVFLVSIIENTALFPRRIWKYDAKTKLKVADALPVGTPASSSYGATPAITCSGASTAMPDGLLVRQYDPYTGELWFITEYCSVQHPISGTQFTVGKMDKAGLCFEKVFSPTFLGYDSHAVLALAPRQMVYTNTGRCLMIVDPVQLSDTDTDMTYPEAYKAGAHIFEFNRTTGAATSIVNIEATRYFKECFFQLMVVEEQNCVYCFTGDALFQKPDNVYKLDLTDNSFQFLYTLPRSPNYADRALTWNYWDKAAVTFFHYDKYRNLIWYFPQHWPASPPAITDPYDPNQDFLMAVSPDTGAIVHRVQLDSHLVDTTPDVLHPELDGTYFWTFLNEYGALTITKDWVGMKTHIECSPANDVQSLQYGTQGVYLKLTFGDGGVYLWEVVRDLSLLSGLTESQIDVTALTDVVLGNQIARPSTARDAIDALRPVYWFDGVESMGKIKYVKRGGAVSKILSDDALAAHTFLSPEMPDKMVTQRITVDDAPRRVTIKYMLAADSYDYHTKFAQRMISVQPSYKEETYEFSQTLTDLQAQGVAQVNLDVKWGQRCHYTVIVPKSLCDIEPTDVIKARGITMKVLDVQESPQRMLKLECTGEDEYFYYPYAVVSETNAPTPLTPTPTPAPTPAPAPAPAPGGGSGDGVISIFTTRGDGGGGVFIRFTSENRSTWVYDVMYTSDHEPTRVNSGLNSYGIPYGVTNVSTYVAAALGSATVNVVKLPTSHTLKSVPAGGWGPYGPVLVATTPEWNAQTDDLTNWLISNEYDFCDLNSYDMYGFIAGWVWFQKENTVMPIPANGWVWPDMQDDVSFNPAWFDTLKSYNRPIYYLGSTPLWTPTTGPLVLATTTTTSTSTSGGTTLL